MSERAGCHSARQLAPTVSCLRCGLLDEPRASLRLTTLAHRGELQLRCQVCTLAREIEILSRGLAPGSEECDLVECGLCELYLLVKSSAEDASKDSGRAKPRGRSRSRSQSQGFRGSR